jgi:hypothetical protein
VFLVLTVDFVNAFPIRLLIFRGGRTRQNNFHFKTSRRTAQGNTTRGIRSVAMKAMPARGNHGHLKLRDEIFRQARSVGKVTGCTTDSGD